MKKEKLIVIHTNDNCKAFKVNCDKTVDISEALNKAKEAAKKDGYRGMLSALPVKYMKEQGLCVAEADTIPIMDELIVPTNAPLSLCTCSECSAYEDGSCFRYGGVVNGFENSIESDCIHGTGGALLYFDDEEIIPYVLHTELEPLDLVKYLLATDDEDFTRLKEKIVEFFDIMSWNTEHIPVEGWNYQYDEF